MLRHVNQRLVVPILVLAAVVFTPATRAAADGGSIQGVVRASSGNPISGVFVKVKNGERRLTFMVVTQAQGRYTADNLPPGKYTVQGIGNGYQSALSAPVEVAVGKTVTADLALTAPQAMMKPRGLAREMRTQASGAAPPPPLPEGEGKNIIEESCLQCHNAQRTATQHFSRARWDATIDRMRGYLRGTTGIPDLTSQQTQVLLDYVATNFPATAGGGGNPGAGAAEEQMDPNMHLPRTPLQGDAARYRVVEYELETRNARTHDITVDSKGVGWVGEGNTGYLGRFDPSTFIYTRIPTPVSSTNTFRLNAIQIAPGDQIWVVDGGPNRRWLQFDVRTGEFNSFAAPKPRIGIPSGNTFRTLPDGSVWLTANTTNQLVRLDPATGEFSSYEVPAGLKAGVSARPYGMTVSGDGKIWFAENSFDIVGRLDPATGKIEEFEVPVKGSNPRRMGTDSEGNPWLGLYGANKLLKIDYRTTKMTMFPLPTENSGPYSVSTDQKNNLIWTSQQWVDQLARLDPSTGAVVEYVLPRPDSDVRRIEVDPNNPNRVWWAGSASDRIGYIETY